MSTPSHGLSPKQKKFADYYLEGIAAGIAYTRAGYSPNGAKEAACRLLKTEKVAAYIEAEQERISAQSRIKQWQLLEFLSDVITTPVGDIDENSILAQEVTRDEIGEQTLKTTVKMVNKIAAIDRLTKMLGWNAPKKVEHSASGDLTQLMMRIRAGRETPAA